MSHYVYILQSLQDPKYYIGETTDVDTRLKFHNGRIVEVRNTKASQIEIGNSYRPSMYFVEITQGNARKQLKLVKQ
jgi:GIY-YIG catalytic domain